MSAHLMSITSQILYSYHLFEENIQLATPISGEVEVLDYFDQILVGYLVDVVCNFAYYQLAYSLLEVLCFAL